MRDSLRSKRSAFVLLAPLVVAFISTAAPAEAQKKKKPKPAPAAAAPAPPPAAEAAPPPPAPPPPPPVAPAAPTPPPSQPEQPAGTGGTSDSPTPEEHSDAPKARTGFQMALRTGVAIPLGNAEADTSMSDGFGPQVPLFVDLGAKIIDHLFIGGYVGLAFGTTAGKISDSCDTLKITCTGLGVRAGVEAQYHFIPAGKINPWAGYGIGYEISGVSGSGNDIKLQFSYRGIEFAHLMGGVDFRITRVFGIGPFADFALGQYSGASLKLSAPGRPTVDKNGDLANTALHQWLTLGVRVTFFP